MILAPTCIEVKPTAALTVAAESRPSWSFAYSPTVVEDAQAVALFADLEPADDAALWDDLAAESEAINRLDAGLLPW